MVSLQTMTDSERKYAILNRVEKMYARFYQNIDLDQIKQSAGVHSQIQVELVFNYWKLKRRFNSSPNKPLMSSRNVDDLMNQTENVLTMRKSMFMNLRLDLERLRNLCYLVSRREKQKRQYNEINRECFSKQVEYLNKYKANTGNYQLQSEPTEPTNPNMLVNHALQLVQRNTFRIRDILQVKNEYCLYDFPEKWTEKFSQSDEKPTKEQDPVPVNIEPTSSLTSNKRDFNLQKTQYFSPTKKLESVTKKIIVKYDQLSIRRNNLKAQMVSACEDSAQITKASPVIVANTDKTIPASANTDTNINTNSSNQDKKKTHKSTITKANIKDISINILNNQKSTVKRIFNENQFKENNRLLRNVNNMNLKNLDENKQSKAFMESLISKLYFFMKMSFFKV